MCQSKRMACCRAANLFGKAHGLEIPNASTLLFSSTSCSAPGRVHFHLVVVDEDDCRRPSSVLLWCAGVSGSWAPPGWIPINSGANASSSSSRRHLADAWLGSFALNSARPLRCSPACARLTLITVMEMDGNIWRRCDLSGGALWRDPKPALRPDGSGCGFSQGPSASARLRKGSRHRRYREPWLRRAGNPACRLDRTS